jgi:hypothetical protein
MVNTTVNFIQQCVSGQVQPEEIDDFIDQWHVDKPPAPLHEFLGMTWDEYALWVERPAALNAILFAHRVNLSFREALERARDADVLDPEHPAPSPDEAKSILQWLNRTGRVA